MPRDLISDIEDIFRTSGSADELFDTFRIAIETRINDSELYKILLRNKVLTPDEIAMYAEKVCREFPDSCYNIFFCVGQVLSSISSYGKHNDRAFKYYKKAAAAWPEKHEPYIAIAGMYNPDSASPRFDDVVSALEEGINNVDVKSKLCFALSNLYRDRGNRNEEKKYQSLGEKFQRNGT